MGADGLTELVLQVGPHVAAAERVPQHGGPQATQLHARVAGPAAILEQGHRRVHPGLARGAVGKHHAPEAAHVLDGQIGVRDVDVADPVSVRLLGAEINFRHTVDEVMLVIQTLRIR